jgi:hypothetical protein
MAALAKGYTKNKHQIRMGWFMGALTLALVVATHIPILIKNYRMFGGILLSTQPGFELLQGHNPYADGKWTMAWTDPGEPLYDYTIARLPHLHQLDQYTESRERARLAMAWIKENPLAELRLLLRKLVWYFTPDNSPFYPGTHLPGYNWYNPVNLIVHALFLLAILLPLLRPAYFGYTFPEVFCLMPVLATLLLSLVFFFGHRWRFYAEPFMILWGCLFIQKLITKPKSEIATIAAKLN